MNKMSDLMNRPTFLSVKEQNQQQAVDLIKLLLRTRKGCEYDGIQAMRFFIEMWGIYADHHVYTEIMDDMTRNSKATITQGWGNVRFRIN